MSRPCYTRIYASTRGTQALAALPSGVLPVCDNPRFVEPIVVPTPPEPRKKCTVCKRLKPGESFAPTGRGIVGDGRPLRKKVCVACEQKGGAA